MNRVWNVMVGLMVGLVLGAVAALGQTTNLPTAATKAVTADTNGTLVWPVATNLWKTNFGSYYSYTLLSAGSAAEWRTNLAVVPGVDVQGYDEDLATIAGLTTSENDFLVRGGAAWEAQDPATARSSMGLGSMALQNSNDVNITGGTISNTIVNGVGVLTISNVVSSVAALVALDTTAITNAVVLGYRTPGDGGGGTFYFDLWSSAATNLGLVFMPADEWGRWIRVTDGGEVNVLWFGAKGDYSAYNQTNATDNYASIQAAINTKRAVYIPGGNYKLSDTLVMANGGQKLRGDGPGFDWSGGTLTTTCLNIYPAQATIKITSNDVLVQDLSFEPCYDNWPNWQGAFGVPPATYGGPSSQGTCGISIEGTSYVTVRNVLSEYIDIGFRLQGAYMCTLDNVRARQTAIGVQCGIEAGLVPGESSANANKIHFTSLGGDYGRRDAVTVVDIPDEDDTFTSTYSTVTSTRTWKVSPTDPTTEIQIGATVAECATNLCYALTNGTSIYGIYGAKTPALSFYYPTSSNATVHIINWVGSYPGQSGSSGAWASIVNQVCTNAALEVCGNQNIVTGGEFASYITGVRDAVGNNYYSYYDEVTFTNIANYGYLPVQLANAMMFGAGRRYEDKLGVGVVNAAGGMGTFQGAPVVRASEADMKVLYLFNEGAGEIVFDRSGNGNHGTLQYSTDTNIAAYWAAHKWDNPGYFYGRGLTLCSSNYSLRDINVQLPLTCVDASQPYTIAVCYRPAEDYMKGTLFYVGCYTNPTTIPGQWIQEYSGSQIFRARDSEAGGIYWGNWYSPTHTSNKWNWCVMAVDPQGNTNALRMKVLTPYWAQTNWCNVWPQNTTNYTSYFTNSFTVANSEITIHQANGGPSWLGNYIYTYGLFALWQRALTLDEATRFINQWQPPAEALTRTYEATLVWDPASLSDGVGETSGDVSVPLAALGDYVMVSPPASVQGLIYSGYVSSSGVVNIRVQNETGGTVDLGSGTWKVRVCK